MKTTLGAALVAAAFVPLSAHAAEFARVLSATPVTTSVAEHAARDRTDDRAGATGIGAVAGAAIGNGVEVNAANAYPPTAVPVQRCQTVSAYEDRTIGYDVVYEYAVRVV